MKKFLNLTICTILLFISFNIRQTFALSKTSLINDYITISSISKSSDNTIIIKYKFKKNAPQSTSYKISSYWQVYDSSDTSKKATLNTDKKTHTVKLKAKKELIGPQYVDITAIVAGGHYVQGKTIKTFYTYPETKTSEHTLTKKEALADHFMIISGIGLIKFVGKKSPYKLALDLAAYVAGVTYTLKGLNVVSGYPTPSAGQYIRTTTSYSSNGMKLDIKMWSSKESYKKGVKPSYKYSQTHPWK